MNIRVLTQAYNTLSESSDATDDLFMNATVSKFFPKGHRDDSTPLLDTAGSKAIDTQQSEEDSLELMEVGPPGGGAPSFRTRSHPQDFQTCGFTPVRHAEYPGSHFRVVGGRKAKPGK